MTTVRRCGRSSPSLLGAAELVSLDLFLIMLAGGAGAGAVAALLGAPFALQAILAAVTSVALLGRPPTDGEELHSGPTCAPARTR